MKENKQLTQENNSLLDKAVLNSDVSGVKNLIEIEGDNKPDQETINSNLFYAVLKKKWDIAIALCSMQGDNKPNESTVRLALSNTILTQNDEKTVDCIKAICSMVTDNKPAKKTMTDAVVLAAIMGKWDIVNYLLSLETENKPDLEELLKETEKVWDNQQTAKKLQSVINELKESNQSTKNTNTQHQNSKAPTKTEPTPLQKSENVDKPKTDNKLSKKENNNPPKKAVGEPDFDGEKKLLGQKDIEQPDTQPKLKGKQYPQKTIENQPQSDKKANTLEESLRQNPVEQNEQKNSNTKDIPQNSKSEVRKEMIDRASSKLEEILKNLSQKIGTDEQKNRFTKAYDRSVNLLEALKLAKDQYLEDLKDVNRSVLAINQSFESQCNALIGEAKPLLERDLGWGDYLTNLSKSIANAILWAVTFGKSNTFFPLTKSESLSVVEDAQSKLKPD